MIQHLQSHETSRLNGHSYCNRNSCKQKCLDQLLTLKEILKCEATALGTVLQTQPCLVIFSPRGVAARSPHRGAITGKRDKLANAANLKRRDVEFRIARDRAVLYFSEKLKKFFSLSFFFLRQRVFF